MGQRAASKGVEKRLAAAGRRAVRYIKPKSDQAYLLQVIQPALLGLMDGSVSTLAPLFASVFATRHTHTAFLVGAAAAVGAGISMGFAEALSDTGEVTGRGHRSPADPLPDWRPSSVA
jgi:hypothetical protein